MSTESLQMVFILLQFSLSSPQKMTASDLYLPAAYHPQSDPFAFSVFVIWVQSLLFCPTRTTFVPSEVHHSVLSSTQDLHAGAKLASPAIYLQNKFV